MPPLARDAPHPRPGQAIGAEAEQLCQMLFAVEGRVGQRKLWGIVGLAKRYPRRLDCACARPLAEGVHSYRHVKVLTEQLMADALPRATPPAVPGKASRR